MSRTNVRQNGSTLRDNYHAATVSELRATSFLRRLTAAADQRLLFPHSGQIELTKEAMDLGSWRSLTPEDLSSVSMDYIPEYSRFAAGGARGGFPSFGVHKRLGAPLVLDLRTGERIALLVGFKWWTGTTKDAGWFTALREFASNQP